MLECAVLVDLEGVRHDFVRNRGGLVVWHLRHLVVPGWVVGFNSPATLGHLRHLFFERVLWHFFIAVNQVFFIQVLE